MKRWTAIAFALSFMSTSATAADNLSCDPPAKEFPRDTGAVAHNWVHIDGHQKGQNCVEFDAAKAISGLKCYTARIVPRDWWPLYQCLLGASCFGVGTFSTAERKSSGKPGRDTVCVTYSNAEGGTHSVGLRLEWPDAKPGELPELEAK
jgi:hypothetical protein